MAGSAASPAKLRRDAVRKLKREGLDPEPRALPALDSLAVTAEVVELRSASWLPADVRWIGLGTGSPFEATGCGLEKRFDTDSLDAMGVPNAPLKGAFRLDAASDRAKVELRLFADGRASTAWSGDVRLKDPSRFFDTDWQDMEIAAERWFVTDENFVVARNRYCAHRTRLTRQGFVDRHIEAVAQELAQQQVVLPTDLLDAYKRFAARGGELSWQAHPQAPVGRVALEKLPLEERVARLDPSLSVNGDTPMPFKLTSISAEEAAQLAAASALAAEAGAAQSSSSSNAAAAGAAHATSTSPASPAAGAAAVPAPIAGAAVSPAPPVRPAGQGAAPPTAAGTQPPIGPTATAAPVAAAASGSAASAAAQKPVPPAAGVVQVPIPTKPVTTVAKAKELPSYGRVKFDDLEHAVGRYVAIETRFGTRRVGKITSFNRAAVTIDIDEKGTSLPLTVPRGTVLTIELVAVGSG
jgi:hypothetical protein